METQGERLKQLRNSLNLTQTELGAKLNMSKQYFSKAETSTIVLNNKQLVALCVDFNININWLLCGKGTMFIEKEKEKDISEEAKQWFNDMIREEFKKRGL